MTVSHRLLSIASLAPGTDYRVAQALWSAACATRTALHGDRRIQETPTCRQGVAPRLASPRHESDRRVTTTSTTPWTSLLEPPMSCLRLPKTSISARATSRPGREGQMCGWVLQYGFHERLSGEHVLCSSVPVRAPTKPSASLTAGSTRMSPSAVR